MKETTKDQLPLEEQVQKAQEAMPTTVSVNPHYLIQKAIESGNVDAIERMVALAERLQATWARNQYFEALSKFQKDCPIIERSTRVDFTGKKSGIRTQYSYAPMDVLLSAKNDTGETVQALLEKHGFSYETKTKQTEKELTAIVIAHHRAGHSEATDFTVPIDFDSYMSPPQRVRSARTYSIRCAFEDCFGLVTSAPDDDGNAGATDEVRDNLQSGETETVVGSVPAIYWNVRRKGATPEKLQSVLVEAYGPAKRYETRKGPEGWVVVKIDSDMTGMLSDSIKDREATTPKGQGIVDQLLSQALPDFKTSKEQMRYGFAGQIEMDLAAGYLTAEEVMEAKREWNATKSVEDCAAVIKKYKDLAENRALDRDAKGSTT